MSLVDLALRYRFTVFFLLAAVMITGSISYITLPRESSPDVSIPLIIVYTLYPGASPEDVESQLSRPLERELQGVEGLKKLTSASQESASVVTVEFISGTNIDDAMQKVRDRVDRAKPDLPEEAEDPVLQEVNFSDFPVVQVNLAGDVGPVVLKRLAEELQDRLEALPGVLRAGVVGGVEREVQVQVDPERLRLYDLSLQDVVDAVERENVAIPGGDLDLGDLSYAVRVPGEVARPEQVGDFVIVARRGAPVFVRDVATVRFGFEDRDSYARINGEESVALAVQKRLGANIIEVADRVKATVDEMRPSWPAGVKASILGDQSKDIRRMVADLENNILSGLVLVVLVLMFALGLRNAVLVGLAIPFSMLLTFTLIEASGTTLNMIVLFSLVLAVGMLVDNAVVVIENIYRHMQEGKSRLEAAGIATHEVGGAIITSTLTTVGAFAPLLFWPGVIGDFMYYLPVTVSAVLLASLLVALTVNPVMAATFMRLPATASPGSTAAEGTAVPRRSRLDRLGHGLTAGYRRLLETALDHRLLFLAAAGVLFLAVFGLYGGVLNTGVEFFPETEPAQIFADLDLPPGTRLDKTDQVVRELEGRLAGTPDLRVLASSVGAGSQADFAVQQGGDATKARLILDLVDRPLRAQSSFLTLAEVRRKAAGLPGVTLDVNRPPDGPPVGDPLVIEISGQDFRVLGEIASRVRSLIADIPGLVSLDDDFDLARPELRVIVDRTQAARLGLSMDKVARTVRTAINGTEASVYRYGKDEADVVVRLQAAARTLADLERLTVVTDDGEQIPLSVIARLERTSSLSAINHKGQRRVVTVSGKVTSPELAEPVRSEARRRLEAAGNLLPPGYILGFAGQSEDEEETKAFLSRAFLYAVLVVLALMVAKFNSLAIPTIVITSVLMSMVGVLIGLMVSGLPFGIIMTGLGVISLAGIVVNNAIVLLDYGEQLRAQGMPRRQLVIETGLRRLRPVLLTAITTVLGLIPLATGVELDFHTLVLSTGGESSQWWKGMAVAVIFGLGFATFLTLVLVPVLYDLLLDLRERRAAASLPLAEVG